MGFGARAGWLGVVLAVAGAAHAQAAGSPAPGGGEPAGAQQPVRTRANCVADNQAPSQADQALWARKYDDAQVLYAAALQADPASGKALAGLVRTALRQDKVDEALALAIKFRTARPEDPDVLDALGEVRFRRGEVGEASLLFNTAGHLGPCDARVHYDAARFLNLYGMYASAQQRLDYAHALAPNDAEIARRWRQSHASPMTPDQQLAALQDRLDHPAVPPKDDERQGIEAAIKAIETRQKGSCDLVTPVTEAKLPMVPIGAGASAYSPEGMVAAGLDVEINGKRKRLEIDTGASGLLLSRSAAKAAGLVPELETKAGGIGDQGPANAYVTHVDDIRVGAMEFRNCMVRVVETSSVLDTDGLIGTDVFRDFVVTLDIPSREVRLGPLPRRPEEKSAKPVTLQTSDQDAPMSIAESAQDRYIAPEMKDWTPVFRSDHFLIFPTVIGNAPTKLFMMDTGAMQSMISPAAAREVTHVSGDPYVKVKGISGEVQNVMAAENVSITFAGVRQVTRGMEAFDSSLLTRAAGAELSGAIGFPTLRELVISIDYRDNLVHVVYDPKKGYHAH